MAGNYTEYSSLLTLKGNTNERLPFVYDQLYYTFPCAFSELSDSPGFTGTCYDYLL